MELLVQRKLSESPANAVDRCGRDLSVPDRPSGLQTSARKLPLDADQMWAKET